MNGVMENIKEIAPVDLEQFNSIVQEYLPGTSKDELYEMYHTHNSLFTGYYIENKLTGVCFGKSIDKDNFQLVGIAIIHPFNKQGRGGKLLKYFEDRVKIRGFTRISLGSADGYVEHFYLKNNFAVSSLKILTDNDEWKEKTSDTFPISRVETQGNYTKLVVENINYESTDKQEICKYYGGFTCFYIFEKNISP
jgi:GNAT superfamily N-acetyltransferase